MNKINYISMCAAFGSVRPVQYVVMKNTFTLSLIASLLLAFFWNNGALQAQSCNCKEYIYLNEPVIGAVLKFEVGAGVPLTEVTGTNGAGHWYPGTGASELPFPHGIAYDLNGKLYIGSSFTAGSPIREFNCDGAIEAISGATPIVADPSLSNMFSIGNTLYTTRNGGPAAYNLCTGALIGTMCLNDAAGNPVPVTTGAWGLHYNPSTETVTVTIDDFLNHLVYKFTRQELEAGIAGGPCINGPLITQGSNLMVNPGEKLIPSNMRVQGVTTDNAGNIYISGWDQAPGAPSPNPGIVVKYNAAGEFVTRTPVNTPILAFTRGIVWSELTNRIYLTNQVDDPAYDCISVFDADLNYLGTGAPNPNLPATDNQPKALGIIKECCPVGLPAAFTKNVCGAVGQKFYLNQEAFNSCGGVVCGSSWVPQGALTGMTFDACDNSVTITDPTACGTFNLSIGAVTSTGCGPQTSVFTICGAPVTFDIRPTVSGCYQNSGSKSTVSLEVDWENVAVSPIANDASDQITVTFAGQTKYINPGPYTTPGGNGIIISPQVVALEVDANGSAQTAQVFIGASYNAASCKSEQTGIALPTACPPTVCVTGQTGGTVFYDYNADGIRQAGEVAGFAGITVQAYDCNGNLVATATTNTEGKYVFSGIPPSAYPIRVEFSGLPTIYGQGTPNGTDGRTTVQFVSAADCNVDLGVLDPNDYCQTNPLVVTPCYLAGDPQDPGSATDNALVGVNYDFTGGNIYYATMPQVGTVWGVAYKKSNNIIYSAAFVKRHSGLGPNGLGAIYQTNLSTSTTSLFANVATLPGVNLGTISSNAARGLGAKNIPNADPEAFAKVGKVGMGDLDISEDGSTLYFVNLFERKLHSINIASPTAAPGVAIPNPGCSGGEFRPWALKVYKGKVYVGVICDAGTSQNKSDLRAYVYTFDIAGGAFDPLPVFDFPLTYPKGYPFSPDPGLTGWFPWTDDFNTILTNGRYAIPYETVLAYPQPMLSDIEFDIDGSMILGFNDRAGVQTGAGQPDPNGNGAYSSIVGGDILRAFYNGGVFVLENNAKAGPATGNSPNNNQGPGFGEFYYDDFATIHTENAMGSLAVRPGSGEAVYTVVDPVVVFSGGLRRVSNTNGFPNAGYTVVAGFSNGLFNKAQSLGDIELTCGNPTYLQIGNYVWIDTDKDGVQDPCESPLPGVSVSLYKVVAGTPSLVAVTTTGANGEYYFTNNTVAGETWLNGATGLEAAMDYKIVFGYNGQTSTAQYTANNLTVGGNDYILTALNVGEGTNIDLNDSDASLMAIAGGSYPSIDVTTGALGTVKHTYDAGFWFCQDITNPSATQSFCEGNTGSDITVQTTTNAGSSIRFVRFTTDQMAASTPSAAEALAIYSGTTVGTAVTPTGIANPYTATLTTSAAGWSTQAPGTYYVYAILNTDQGVSCRPVQEIIVTIVDLPVLTTTPASICAGATVNLATLVTGNTPAGALTYYTSPAAANAGSGALANTTVAPAATTTYYVRSQTTSVCYSIAPITVNVNTAPDFSVTNGTVCPGGSIDLATLVTNTGGGTLTYHTTLAAAQSGAPALASSTVSPSGATNYYVRSINGSGCYTVKELTVTLQAANCGTIQITGPNNN